ncbi:MAG: hypothetical protein K2H13_08225 [Eubacterium sp.]|nr:hypothetical protein [Eubacterium sp.]
MKKAARLAVCGIITALSVVLLFFGGIAFVLAYIMPMLIGLLAIMLKRTFGAASAWITYAATSLLSFVLVPDKECVLMYVMFFGFYPIIHDSLNKIKISPLKVLSKFLIFNIAVFAAQLLLIFVFGIPFLEEGEGKWLIILFTVLMNILFVMYDKILVVLTRLYEIKLEKKIRKLFL